MPVKQAVISPSALSLLYPSEGIAGYPQEKFLSDLVNEAARDIRGCLELGAHCVQIDFTEGRLAVKLDPTRRLLSSFIALINRVLAAAPALSGLVNPRARIDSLLSSCIRAFES